MGGFVDLVVADSGSPNIGEKVDKPTWLPGLTVCEGLYRCFQPHYQYGFDKTTAY